MKEYKDINDCVTLLGEQLYEITFSGRKLYHKVIEVNIQEHVIKTRDEFGSLCTVLPSNIGTILFIDKD